MSIGDRVSGGCAPGVRRVTAADVGRVTELFVLAFCEDPTWSWAFPDPLKRVEQHRALWSLYLHSALPYGWVRMTEDGGAASLWIPPGRPELSAEDEARYQPMVREMLGAHADDVLTLVDRFEENHPREQPH